MHEFGQLSDYNLVEKTWCIRSKRLKKRTRIYLEHTDTLVTDAKKLFVVCVNVGRWLQSKNLVSFKMAGTIVVGKKEKKMFFLK